eukprot:gene720-1184_t
MANDWSTQSFAAVWYMLLLVAVLVILLFVLGLPLGLAVLTWSLHQQKQITVNGQTTFCAARKLAWEEGAFYMCNGDAKVPVSLEFPDQADGISGPCLDQDAQAGGQPESTLDRLKAWMCRLLSARPSTLESATNMLDTREVQEVLGSVYRAYRKRFYWWGAYEVLQRLAQSSAVLLVNLINPDWATLYALLVACTSLMVHGYVQPYREDIDNILQMLVLYNHCIAIMFLIANEHIVGTSSGSDTIGYLMIGINLALSVVILTVLAYSLQEFVIKRNMMGRGVKILKRVRDSVRKNRVSVKDNPRIFAENSAMDSHGSACDANGGHDVAAGNGAHAEELEAELMRADSVLMSDGNTAPMDEMLEDSDVILTRNPLLMAPESHATTEDMMHGLLCELKQEESKSACTHEYSDVKD